MKGNTAFALHVLFGLFLFPCPLILAEVIEEDDKTYIRDRRGEKWDITQAVSIGFDPDNFEFGLGRNAFRPLDDKHLQSRIENISREIRILGVPGKTESKAFAIRKLSGHEIANSHIDDKPIAAAY